MRCRAAAAWLVAAATVAGIAHADGGIRLDVPVVVQAPERCGPAALTMVLRFLGAGGPAVTRAEAAYDPALKGTLVTDLAAAAREAGYRAEVRTLAVEDLPALLAGGVPPIVLYQNGPGPLTRAHYAVVTAWDPGRRRFTLNDGGARPRTIAARDLERRWRTAGRQALIVRPPATADAGHRNTP